MAHTDTEIEEQLETVWELREHIVGAMTRRMDETTTSDILAFARATPLLDSIKFLCRTPSKALKCTIFYTYPSNRHLSIDDVEIFMERDIVNFRYEFMKQASFLCPRDCAVDPSDGSVWIVDHVNSIQKILPDGLLFSLYYTQTRTQGA